VNNIERYGIAVAQVYERADGTDCPVRVVDVTTYAHCDDVVIECVNGAEPPTRIEAFKLARVRYCLKVDATEPGATFCWHCGKSLSRYVEGGIAFALVKDESGASHRVHKARCADGYEVVGATTGGQVKLGHSK
jgi:hypothetical protein